MLRLRRILLSNKIFYIILLLSVLICIFRLNIKRSSNLDINTKSIIGTVTNISYNGDNLGLVIKINNHESIKAYYSLSSIKEKNRINNIINLGGKVKVEGTLEKPLESKVDNTFNYSKYLVSKKIYYLFKVESITYLKDSSNIIYIIKNKFLNYIETFKSSSYIKMMLLGEMDDVKKDVINSYRDNGISHLFAISGTQVSVLAEVILLFLTKIKIKEKSRYIIVNIFTFSYLFLTNTQPAVLRAVLAFFLGSINKYNYFYVSNINIFLLTLSITLFINPYYIYDLGFLYSYLISFSLILCSKYLENKSKFNTLLLTSIISFLVSMPITMYNFYSLNFLGIIYNLFYVPFVNYLLFPLCIIVLVVPLLDKVLLLVINILEVTSLYLSRISTFKFIFGKLNISIYIIYLVLLFLFYIFKKKRYIACFLIILLIHYYSFLALDDFIYMIDVGQGDSTLVYSKGESMLIDTGGIKTYNKEKWMKRDSSSLALNKTLVYLKSKGIKKINKLVLTHGDFDHLGEATTILDNYKVECTYINEGRVNFYEKKIKDKYKTKVMKEGTTFNIGNFSFISLNHNLNDENDSSIVLYGKYDNLSMMFMGDSSIRSEESILNNYNLGHINILKVGHHGSRTSTSNQFLNTINPDIALISAGVNNKFNHPHKEIIERLKKHNVEYYVTSRVGSIEINLRKKMISTYMDKK